jgi:transposase
MGSESKATSRRYTAQQREQAVRLVRKVRAETGLSFGAVQRVASQLGYGVESVRSWVKQADIDEGMTEGVSSVQTARIRELEQENRELRRANEILKRASAFFAAELDRPQR